MPPLTITADGARADRRHPGRGDRGADREVSAREVADAAGAMRMDGARRRTGESGRRRSAEAIRGGAVARHPRPRRRRAGGAPRRERQAGGLVRLERLPRPGRSTRRSRGARAALDRWGWERRGAADRRLASGALRARGELASWKGAERALLFPTGFAANLGGARDVRGPEAADLLRRAQPRLDHRRLPARPGAGRRSTATAISTPSLRCCATPQSARRQRDRVLDGRRPRPGRGAGHVCAGHGALLVIDEAHAVLGPHPELAGVEALRVGTLSKTLGALGGYVAGPGPVVGPLPNPPPPLLLHHRPPPAGGRGGGGPRGRPPRGGRGAPRGPRRPPPTARPPAPPPRPRRCSSARPRARSPPPRRCWRRAFWCRRSVRRPCPREARACA